MENDNINYRASSRELELLSLGFKVLSYGRCLWMRTQNEQTYRLHQQIVFGKSDERGLLTETLVEYIELPKLIQENEINQS